MLDWLERNQVFILAAVIAALGLGFAVREVTRDDPPPLEFRYGSGLPAGSPIRVHVAGAVLSPGVYELHEGDRVADAIDAAGGPADDADAEEINLARRVRDEEQLIVPRQAGKESATTAVLTPGVKVNINTAPASVLDALPGIGEAYAGRIVDSRRVDGAFRSTQELVERKVIPRATYDRISSLISVGP